MTRCASGGIKTHEKQMANPWKPGQCGNPSGRPRGAVSLTTRVMRVLKRRVNPADPNDARTIADVISEAIVKQAAKGKTDIVRMLWDRCDGKVPDQIQVSEHPGWEPVFADHDDGVDGGDGDGDDDTTTADGEAPADDSGDGNPAEDLTDTA